MELAEQYDRFPTNLTIYLASCVYDAIEDMTAHGGRSPADLFDRFLGWARASRVSGSSAGSQS